MNPTTIEWVKNPDGSQGYTSNPFTGCLNGCPYCYARKLANGRLRQRYKKNTCIPVQKNSLEEAIARTDPFYPRFWPERLKDLDIKSPRGVFLCDMSDWCAPWWPVAWREELMAAIGKNPQHRIYLLTHQPQELHGFSPFPDNCWVGVTATDMAQAMDALDGMSNVKAKIRFLSLEPLLGPIPIDLLFEYDWLITGAMTGKRKQLIELNKQYPDLKLTRSLGKWTLQPKLEWILEIVDAAGKAHTPVFLKLNLVPGIADSLNPEKMKLQDGIWLRQEMPGDI